MDHSDPRFANQEEVFNNVGKEVLKNSMSGFNACIFAYGQTGSGKSYSMMGAPNQPGLIPRITNEMYNLIEQKTSDTLKFKVRVRTGDLELFIEQDIMVPSNRKCLNFRYLSNGKGLNLRFPSKGKV